MLNRRTFLRMAGALGLGSLWSGAGAAASAGSSATERVHHTSGHDRPGFGSTDCSPSAIPQIERFEDLLDDLNCVEVATKLSGNWLQEVSGRDSFNLKFKMYCPICPHSSGDPMMTVSPSYYWCEGCRIGGTAIDLHQRMTRLPYGESMDQLETLLQSREIEGHRPEYEYQWKIWQATISFYHEVLLRWPEADTARTWLAEQGISRETCEAFQIGYAPHTLSSLPQFFFQQGLLSHHFDERWEVLESCGQDQLLLPITDWHGHFWGILKQPLQHFPGRRGSCTETVRDISPRRLRRLVFAPPSVSEAYGKKQTLITRDAWDVVALYNAGIRNTGYWLLNRSSADTAYALRTTLAHTSTIILPWHADTASLETLLALVGPAVNRVRLLILRKHDRLVELLHDERAEGVQKAMVSAIPLAEWLG